MAKASMDSNKVQTHVLATITQFVTKKRPKKHEGFRFCLDSKRVFGRLAGMFGMTQGKVNYALRKLVAQGLVTAIGEGKTRRYTVPVPE